MSDYPMTVIEMANAIFHKYYGSNVDPDEREGFVEDIYNWLDQDEEYSSAEVDELVHEYGRKVWYESGMNDWRDYPEYRPKDPTPLPSILDLKDKRK